MKHCVSPDVEVQRNLPVVSSAPRRAPGLLPALLGLALLAAFGPVVDRTVETVTFVSMRILLELGPFLLTVIQVFRS